MRGHGLAEWAPKGLTDHSTHDLHGTVAPLQIAVEDAGKDEKSLSGGWGGAPRFCAAEGSAF
jgi:hypothetical protein